MCVTTFLSSSVSKKGRVDYTLVILELHKRTGFSYLMITWCLLAVVHTSANRKFVALPPCLLELSFERSV